MLDILQQVSSCYLASWSSSIMGWAFSGCLAGVPHHFKCLALVVYSLFLGLSWTYCNRFQVITFPSDFKWLSFQLIFKWFPNFGGTVNHPHDHTHQMGSGRPPVSCTGNHPRWCDVIRNWFPFQLTWTFWAPGLHSGLRRAEDVKFTKLVSLSK